MEMTSIIIISSIVPQKKGIAPNYGNVQDSIKQENIIIQALCSTWQWWGLPISTSSQFYRLARKGPSNPYRVFVAAGKC